MNILEHHHSALYPGHHPSAISAGPRYDMPFRNSEGRDSHGFRHSSTVAYPSEFHQNFDYRFDFFTGDLKAMRVKQNHITFQDNFAVNQEESRQPVSDTKNASDVCAQLLSRSTFWPQAHGSLSLSMNVKEDIVTHNAEHGIYDGVNYIQMEENTNLATFIGGLSVPFYFVIGSGKSRLYQCGCGHLTKRKGDMRRHHETRKHAHKNYTCPCGSSFTRSDSLKRHKTKTCKKGRI